MLAWEQKDVPHFSIWLHRLNISVLLDITEHKIHTRNCLVSSCASNCYGTEGNILAKEQNMTGRAVLEKESTMKREAALRSS